MRNSTAYGLFSLLMIIYTFVTWENVMINSALVMLLLKVWREETD
ncbi:hypothetical protein [Bacillus thuringiensis]|nr:hypothetical protein [Bacillus thuringiensis]